MQRSRIAAELLALTLLCCEAVLGQADSATITGTVTNPSGAGVAHASVSARNLASGQTAAAQSDAAGVYTLV
ncbi:MAG TPA: carboxypeptidase-like regulatory domain-containing protein, partial [Bryobacteraceae bacterium]|nr:carboxypeptidase-like regulatory domain-containing protein [Bryobacteraceae bacterium]